jgi:tetratricopeptide (TPR) repeat protein
MAGIGNRAERRRQAAKTAELTEALAHHRAGRLDRAEALYRKFLEKSPGHADALHLLGIIALARGDPDRAIRLIGRALTARPDFAEGHSNLGNAYRAACRFAEAAASYRRALALRPDFAAAHSNLAVVLGEQGDFAAAVASARRAVALDPQGGEARFNLAAVLRQLAANLRGMGDLDGATEGYREALTLRPGDAPLWNDLGRCFHALGRFDDAVAAYRRAIALDPDFADPYRNLAACRELTAADAEIARIAALAERTDLPAEERVAAGFALGKALDDSERYDEAFAAYDRANRLYRAARAEAGDRFDAAELSRAVDRSIAEFTAEFFAGIRDWGNPSEVPVFIVGLPRSGTSLVEQIAASHSRVFGAGELRNIGETAAALGPSDGWTREAVRRAADGHLERLRAVGSGAERVIDKMPDNIFMLGVIAALYPAARVIFCRRDPRDIGLSCHFQKFSAGLLTFSYDLADCGRRIRETERLTAYWRCVLSLRWIDIHYEALVADLAGESRRLIGFLGLEWEPACLDFHRTERAVQTASSWQVRQPLYDRSVGRWRHYERHLAPLLEALET